MKKANPYCITQTEFPWFWSPKCILPCHYQNEILCMCVNLSLMVTSKLKSSVTLECQISFTIHQHVLLCYVELNCLSDSHIEPPLFSQIWESKSFLMEARTYFLRPCSIECFHLALNFFLIFFTGDSSAPQQRTMKLVQRLKYYTAKRQNSYDQVILTAKHCN